MNMLMHTDFLHVAPVDVARFYMRTGGIGMLPIDIPCVVENYGIITRRDVVLSSGALLLLRHLRDVARELSVVSFVASSLRICLRSSGSMAGVTFRCVLIGPCAPVRGGCAATQRIRNREPCRYSAR